MTMPAHRNRNSVRFIAGGWLVLIAFLLVNVARAETVTLHLRNGASVTGEMISLDVTFITITNAILGKFAVPVVEVRRIEKKNTPQAVEPPPSPTPTTVATNPPAGPNPQRHRPLTTRPPS